MTATIGRGLAWSAANNLTIRVGNVLVGVLLARLLDPESFGIFAVGLACQMVLVTLADLGLGADLVRRGDFDRRGPVVALLALAFSGLLAALMAGFAEPIATALGSSEATGVVQVLALTILLTGAALVPYCMLQRQFRQRETFQADAASLVVSTGVVVTLIFAGLGPMALAWSRVAGQLTALLLLYRAARVLPRLGWDRVVAREAIAVGVPLALANLLSWAVLSIHYVVVGRTLGAVALGLFMLAFNVSAWPISALGQAVRNVALPAFAQHAGGRSEQERVLGAALGLLFTGGLFMGVMISVLAEPLVVAVYGEQWRGAAAALVGLGLFGGVRLATDLVASYLVARGTTRAVMSVQVVWLVALVPALVVGARAYGIAGVAFAHLAVVVLVVVPAMALALRSTGLRPLHLVRPLLPALLAALPTALLVWAVDSGVESPWFSLLAAGTAGTALYGAIVALPTRGRLRQLRARTTTHDGAAGVDEVLTGPAAASTSPAPTATPRGVLS